MELSGQGLGIVYRTDNPLVYETSIQAEWFTVPAYVQCATWAPGAGWEFTETLEVPWRG